MSRQRARTTYPDQRKRDLAQIHIAKAQLGLDEDTYRAMLFAIGRVASAADLDQAGRHRVLEHLRSRGFRPAAHKPLRDPRQRKILALWLGLRDAGVLQVADDAALAHWIERQTGVARLEWLDTAQAQACIEALKAWLARLTPNGAEKPAA